MGYRERTRGAVIVSAGGVGARRERRAVVTVGGEGVDSGAFLRARVARPEGGCGWVTAGL